MRFDKRAAVYERHAAPQAAVARRLASWIPPATPGESALELGAGTGLLTRALLEKGHTVLATDCSPAMLRTGRAALPDARWELLDARFPPAGGCDRLFSSSLLQWIFDPKATLARHRDALRPGGVMLHALFVNPTLRALRDLLPAESAPFVWRDPGEWKNIASDAGLAVTRSEIFSLTTRHPGALALLRDIHATGAVDARPAVAPTRLRNALRDYDRQNTGTDGLVRAEWSALIFEAKKA